MEFKLHTYDIQELVIAAIERKCKNDVEEDTKETLEKVIDILSNLNNLCTKENDYTITIKAE